MADFHLTLGGLARSYRLFVPPGLRGPAPYVVAMAGWAQRADPDMYMHLRAYARARHYVLLELRGYGSSWNAGSCCGDAMTQRVNDRAALSAMIASASHAYPLDRHRLYLVGFSNGGMMAYDYACRNPGTVAAIGVVSSAYMSSCAPRQAVPVMDVHGGIDGVLPYRGGWSNFLKRNVPSLAQSQSQFRALDAGAGAPERNVFLAGADHVWPRLGWQGNFDTTGQLLGYLLAHHR